MKNTIRYLAVKQRKVRNAIYLAILLSAPVLASGTEYPFDCPPVSPEKQAAQDAEWAMLRTKSLAELKKLSAEKERDMPKCLAEATASYIQANRRSGERNMQIPLSCKTDTCKYTTDITPLMQAIKEKEEAEDGSCSQADTPESLDEAQQEAIALAKRSTPAQIKKMFVQLRSTQPQCLTDEYAEAERTGREVEISPDCLRLACSWLRKMRIVNTASKAFPADFPPSKLAK